jgi:hypothetical protein
LFSPAGCPAGTVVFNAISSEVPLRVATCFDRDWAAFGLLVLDGK